MNCGRAFAGLGALALLVTACGHPAAKPAAAATTTAADLRTYLTQVEAVRLPVNALLEDADPILEGLHDHKVTPEQASERMGALEKRFADYLLAMQQIRPAGARLRAINAPYAYTYLLEDSYLATLASDVADGDYDNLPTTQGQQRLAIIEWRTQLELLAAELKVALPDDIQQAGRGEIAPGVEGS